MIYHYGYWNDISLSIMISDHDRSWYRCGKTCITIYHVKPMEKWLLLSWSIMIHHNASRYASIHLREVLNTCVTVGKSTKSDSNSSKKLNDSRTGIEHHWWSVNLLQLTKFPKLDLYVFKMNWIMDFKHMKIQRWS